ncbi:MAG TPA: aspartate aminotransferase family protein [Alphaproteobacteria bacterium]|nr:aspartate aminotransferase family protein [Alphaproteobacteria bacterium]
MNDIAQPLSNEAALKKSGAEHVFMHGSSYGALNHDPGKKVLVEGKGVWVTDIDGNRYIDALAGLWLVNVGHGRSEIGEAIARQASTLAYASSTAATTIPAIQLAERLSAITPGDQNTVFFCSGGSEAVESALKIARQYHYHRGEPKRQKIIGRRGSYHGGTYAAMSVSGTRPVSDPYHSPFMPGVLHASPPYCYRCDFRQTYPACDLLCAEQIGQMIEYENPKTVAAVIAEPISASNGIVVPPDGYWQCLREICDKHGVLLITDEVINGFGRTGKMFASEHFGVVGDMLTMAKGLTSGYVPMGGVMCRPHVVEAFEGQNTLSHLITYGGHPVAAAAALANLDIIEREGLVENAAKMGALLKEGLEGLRAKHACIGDVRGLGLIAGVEVVKDRVTKEKFAESGPELKALNEGLRSRGLLTRAGTVINLCPPLCINADEVHQIVEIVGGALTDLEEAAGLA